MRRRDDKQERERVGATTYVTKTILDRDEASGEGVYELLMKNLGLCYLPSTALYRDFGAKELTDLMHPAVCLPANRHEALVLADANPWQVFAVCEPDTKFFKYAIHGFEYFKPT